MRKTSTIALCSIFALAAACSETSEPGDNTLDGTWAYSASATSEHIEGTCTAVGSIELDQSGAVLGGDSDGDFTCTGPAGTLTESAAGTVEGTVNGSAVVIDAEDCTYTGTVNSENAMSGTVECAVEIDETTYPFSGTWTATRS